MKFELHVVSLPMVTKFRGLTNRETAFIRGPRGWGEFSVFDDYDDAAAALWLLAAIEAAYVEMPAPRRRSVPVNATLPALPAAEVGPFLDRYSGCSTVKVKVAEGDDLDRIAAAADYLGASGKIRIDANGGWSVDQAEAMITAVHSLIGEQLEYVEQPCKTVEELAELRQRLAGRVLIAADESIRRSADPLRVRDLGAADILVLKVAPLGGVYRTLELLEALKMPAVVSSELSSSVGLQAGVALAAAMPDLPYACGLGTSEIFERDVTTHPLRPIDGQIALRTVDPDLMVELAAPPARQEWWRARAVAAWHAGTAELVQERGWSL